MPTSPMNLRPIFLAVTTLLLAPLGHADFVTGTVVDANGAPVAGVNIVAVDLVNGGNGLIANAGTNAFGVFYSTILPGTYEFTFEPPAPPAAVALATVVGPVAVLGTTSLGTVVLDPAVSLQGRLLQQNGLPASGVNLDVIHLATGVNIDLIGDTSSPLGEFIFAVPPGELELRLKPSQVTPPLLAPRKFDVSAPTNRNLGDIVLEPGFMVSGAVLGPTFAPVRNLDVDVIDTVRGDELYTPGDNTDSNGFVDFVVPAGVFDLELCPRLEDNLVAKLLPAMAISATTNLGIQTMAAGVRLTGNVTSYLGAPVLNTDIDLRDVVTLQDVLLCGDNTNVSGDYDIVVPTGTFNLVFTPPDSVKLGSNFAPGVVVAGATVRDSVLPFCDCGTVNGGGVPGSGGITPVITPGSGALRLGSHGWGFNVSQGLGGAFGVASMGFGGTCGNGLTTTGTILGGRMLVSGRVRAALFRLDGTPGLAGAGSADVTFSIPLDFALTGVTLSARVQIFDPAAPSGRSMTPVICGPLCQ